MTINRNSNDALTMSLFKDDDLYPLCLIPLPFVAYIYSSSPVLHRFVVSLTNMYFQSLLMTKIVQVLQIVLLPRKNG